MHVALKRPRSLARGLIVQLAAIFALAPAIGIAVTLYTDEEGFKPAIDRTLEQSADAIVPLIGVDATGRISIDEKAVAASPILSALRFAVYDGRSGKPAILWPRRSAIESWDLNFSYQAERMGPDGLVRIVFFPVTYNAATWFGWLGDELRDEILPFLLALMIVTIPLATFALRRGLRPVKQLAGEARHIEPGRNGARLSEAKTPAELLPLVQAVNESLDRIDRGFSAQRQFSATVAHELRTPLAVLAERLAREGAPLADARAEILRLARLIDQLLIVTELASRRARADAVVDLCAVAREAVAREVPRALAQGVKMELDADCGHVSIRGYAPAIEVALRNLLDNAVRHSPRGGRVITRGFADPPTVEVCDEGPGVPPEHARAIFEPFWRNPRSKGAGVGLAIVREMAELHGAQVSVRANSPHGSIFRIEFPRLEGNGAAQHQSAAERGTAGCEPLYDI